METLIHADIFFFIASAFVVVLTIGFILALVYIIPALKDLRDLSATVKKEGDKIASDIDGIRNTIKEKGSKAKSTFDSVLAFFTRRRKSNHKKTVDK
ncbi:MAG: hypothetical protein AAB482_01465 [Patescibacteria group bacterium]